MATRIQPGKETLVLGDPGNFLNFPTHLPGKDIASIGEPERGVIEFNNFYPGGKLEKFSD